MNYYQQLDRWLSERLTSAVKTILIINVAVFFILLLIKIFSRGLFDLLIALFAETGRPYLFWQFLTYMFIHVAPLHLVFNMLILCFFGRDLEYRWGTFHFWRFYLIVGIGAGLLHALIGLLTPGDVIMYGASGALMGVLLAFAAYFPNQTVFFFMIPIPMKYLVLIIIFLDLFMLGSNDNVSRITHLSGLLIAYLYLSKYHRTTDIRKWRYLR